MKILITFLLLGITGNKIFCQPTVINNTRTAVHKPLVRLKLSLIPPANYDPFPNDSGFYLKNTRPDLGQEQIKAEKLFLNFSTVKSSLLSGGGNFEELQINHYDGVWLRKTETVEGHALTSLTMAFGNRTYTYLLIGVFDSDDNAIAAKLRQSMLSAYVDTFGVQVAKNKGNQASSTAFLQPKFKVDVTATIFKLAEIISDDQQVFTLDGIYPPITADKSKLDIRTTAGTVSEPSYETFSEMILTHNADLSNVAGIQKTSVQVNGLKGIEIVANATYNETLTAAKIYQVTLFDQNQVFTITGIDWQNGQAKLEVLRKITTTFQKLP